MIKNKYLYFLPGYANFEEIPLDININCGRNYEGIYKYLFLKDNKYQLVIHG